MRAHGDRQPRLADAAGTREGDQPHPRSLEQPRDLLDVALAPDEQRGYARQRTRYSPGAARRRGRRLIRAAVLGCEPLAEEHGEIVADQSPELPRGTEGSVRDGPLGLELADHSGEPRFSLGCRCLDIQQAGHRHGEPELVLQARDVHVRTNPSVPLPVQADEDVGLGQIGSIQLPRRVRSSPELEHHRCEQEPGDGASHRGALLRHLGERRAHEDTQSLVGRPDRGRHGEECAIDRRAGPDDSELINLRTK